MKKANTQNSKGPGEEKMMSGNLIYVAVVVIIVFIFLAFSRLFSADFVNMDDPDYIVKNERIRNVNAERAAAMFSAPGGDMYIPLVYLSYAIEYSFAGPDPYLYHLDNILLHVLNSILVLWLVWLLTGSLFSSTVMAALFALHPIHVESVAWVSERKDVLYALFFLGSLISYYFYSQHGKRKYYLVALLLFLLSCFSKPMAISLPAVLLIYDYYCKKRTWKILVNKIPFFVISLIFSLIAIKMMNLSFHEVLDVKYTVLDRIILVLYSLSFYIQKTLLPANFVNAYIYPEKVGMSLPVYYILSALFFLVISLIITFSKKVPAGIKALFLFYIVTIFPVLQFFPNTYTLTADRYSYITILGIFGILIYYAEIVSQRIRIGRNTLWKGAASILCLLSVATYNRTKVWANGITLCTDKIRNRQYNENTFINLAALYDKNNEPMKSIVVLQYADSVYPDNVSIKAMYANMLVETGQFEEAIKLYENCLRIDSTMEMAYLNLGHAYSNAGRTADACSLLLKAHALYPENNTYIYNLAIVYWNTGNKTEAIRFFKMAAENNFEPAIKFMDKNVYIKG